MSTARIPSSHWRRSGMVLLSFVALAGLHGIGLGQTMAQDPVDPRPQDRRNYNQGIAEVRQLMATRQFGRAAPQLDALLAQRPREAQARFLKGVLQTEQGQAEAAVSTFRALIEDYPELPEPYNNLAVLYAQKGDVQNARVALETAIKTAPEWAVAHENLGDIYARMAAEQYERVGNLDRSNKSAVAKLKLARDLLTLVATTGKP
ncbi:MAG: tetratricopeptide repeat protein [Betaproteobacteria bacterium]